MAVFSLVLKTKISTMQRLDPLILQFLDLWQQMIGHNGSIVLSISAPVSSTLLLPLTHLTASPRHNYRLLLRLQQHSPSISKLRRPLRYHHIHHIPFPELLCRAVQQHLPLQVALLGPESSQRRLLHQPLHGSNIQCARVPSVLQYHHILIVSNTVADSILTDAVIKVIVST